MLIGVLNRVGVIPSVVLQWLILILDTLGPSSTLFLNLVPEGAGGGAAQDGWKRLLRISSYKPRDPRDNPQTTFPLHQVTNVVEKSSCRSILLIFHCFMHKFNEIP